MKNFPRRSFLKTLGSVPVLLSLGWAKEFESLAAENPSANEISEPGPIPSALELTRATRFPPGYLSILQGATSETETLFNIFAPRLKNYSYVIVDSSGATMAAELYEKVAGPGFYNIDKVKASGLILGNRYKLRVMDKQTIVDERNFGMLDTRKTNPNFALLSCMCDDYRFSPAIDPMWERLRAENPDFIVLNGDTVYVDSFEFVERKKATEFDLWQRYIDALKRLPLYHWQNLVPVFSTWDDHDYGTNDGDRDFISKDAAARLFRGIFGGKPIAGVWEQGPQGISSMLTAFGQRFFFMDDRTFRQPNRGQITSEDYGHWGQAQHNWLLDKIASDDRPAWIINGNQSFNGKALDFKEAFEANHPKEFVALIEELRRVRAPVVFASGDIHLSEIMRVPAERLGYETFEVTSSPMHSYAGDGWENPMRIDGAYCKEFNFLMIRSRAAAGALQMNVRCLGLAANAYFEKNLSVQR